MIGARPPRGLNRRMQGWIVFDAMGVVFEVGDDTNDLLVPFVQSRHRISAERIRELYLEASLGRISSERFWGAVGLAASYPEIEIEYLETCLTLDKDFPIVAGRLKTQYALGLLSNDVGEWSAFLRRRHALDCFDVVVISGLVGCRKPDRKIFEIFLREAGTTGDSCVLVDDRKKNLSPAKALGFKTIHFERTREVDDFAPNGCIRSFCELEGTLQCLS